MKKNVIEAISSDSARNTKLSGITITSKAFTKSWVNPMLRRLRWLKFINISLSFSRYETSIYMFLASHDNQLYKKFRKDDIFINIGSGAFMHQKWINYDFPGHSHYYKKLQGASGKDFLPIDLSKNLPLPILNNSVRLVYLSHTIEHLPEDSALFLLKEISRILIKNGVLRIVFPDVEANYFFAKACSKQISVDQKVKVNAIIASAYNSFAPSSEYKVSYLMDLFRSKNYDIEEIQKVLKIKDKLGGGLGKKIQIFICHIGHMIKC
jgi:hypothetical protein